MRIYRAGRLLRHPLRYRTGIDRMGRRTVLLIVAALIAALGTALVFLYVEGADNRAEAQ